MKNFIQYTLAATLVAGTTAHHDHARFHNRRQVGSKVEKREPDVVTAYVVAATETVYQLGGEVLDGIKAKQGLDGGKLVVIGESQPTYIPPPPPPPPPTTSKESAALGAQFLESQSSSSPPPPPTTTSTPEPETSTSAAYTPPASSSAKPSKGYGPPSQGGQGVSSKFPSGQIKCSEFPSEYGARALDHLELGGWAGLQFVPGYSADSQSISDIITGIAGQTCSEGCMCSYACPPGYQKTQWPTAQGSTKQSIGGLYCNSDGYLELTRSNSDTLCEPGVGGVTIQNDLDDEVCACRTDYPGTESMVVPACADPGEEVPICNPDQNNYYIWDGSGTSAQYYINKKGYDVGASCLWDSPIDPNGAGNWSPVILGVGRASDGITYISLFQNLPTSHAELDFNVEITGDVNSDCSYINGVWSEGGSGCTTGMRAGGSAVVRYFN